ncbi:hypothetical protein IHE55_22055 [Streptomyces pactum]|uniref:ESX-1 secretion-associated protein n=1 Tax=Streptomyces pactum TaxID=68249 RepID=A0ABS0NQ20_9ACTN|nr:hypothetical protein [Streptomyces pactum]MBH5337297.1 hypothetical protein [Streptomyces pactum]
MSFEQEWAALQAEAKQSVGMRLNEAGGDKSPGAGQGLKVSGSALRGKARSAEEVAKSVGAVDDEALKETGQVKAGLKGFACAAAFETFQERWGDQTRYLAGLLNQSLAMALRTAAATFEEDDKKTGQRAEEAGGSGGNRRVAR